jgi:hypothetical protein
VDPDPGDRDVQTFTAQRTGSLVRGETEISKPGGAADWVMQIVTTDGSGTPTNNVLASTTIANASVPDGDSRIVGLFASPASVVAGQQLGLLITRPGESYTLRDRSDIPCPGQEFFSASGWAGACFFLMRGGWYWAVLCAGLGLLAPAVAWAVRRRSQI